MRIFDLFCFKYNRTDFHELNLDWIISDLRTLAETIENFVSLNTIKYADPIQWNITTQYMANTVVVDPQTGTAYISSKAVPSGVALTNTDYWSVIFTLDIISANKNITIRDDGSNVLATFASAVDDWLLWNGTLYKVSQAININEAYVEGYNLTRYTVEMFINDYIQIITDLIGDLNDLNTTDKSSIVNAINELVTLRGDLTNLSTTDKSSIVNAINENTDNISTLASVVSNIRSSFPTVADMISSDQIVDGEVYRCDGYYAAGDQGFGFWKAQSTADSNFSIATDNGLYMIPIAINGIITANQFGAYGDNTHDDTTAIQNGVNYCGYHGYTFKFLAGTYLTSDCIDISYRQYAIVGSGMERTTIKLDRTNVTVNSVFRFIGYLQWGMTFGNFLLTSNDSNSGSCIRFGDGTNNNNGLVYHSHFLPINFDMCSTAISVVSNTIAFWGCIFDNLIFGKNVTLSCIDNTGGITAGIPNNRFCSVTTYTGGRDNYQRTPLFNMRGYNQIFENVEILNCRQLVFRVYAGGRITINNIKLEAADYTNGTTWLFSLDPYSHINITEMALSGDFSQLTHIFYSTTPESCSVIVNGTIRLDDTSGSGLSTGYTTANLDTVVDIITSQSTPPLPNYTNDNKLKLTCLENGVTVSTNASTTIDASNAKRVVASASGITLDFATVNDRRLSVAANLDCEIYNASTGTITITVDGTTVGTIATGLTKHLVEYTNSYHLI